MITIINLILIVCFEAMIGWLILSLRTIVRNGKRKSRNKRTAFNNSHQLELVTVWGVNDEISLLSHVVIEATGGEYIFGWVEIYLRTIYTYICILNT